MSFLKICLLFNTLFVTSTVYNPMYKEYNDYMNKHNKSYDINETINRFGNYETNRLYVDFHNNVLDNDYVLELNFMGDYYNHEYKRMLGTHYTWPWSYCNFEDTDVPDSFDWRKEGKVSRVKNQGQCGSCWTFSVLGSIESLYAIVQGRDINLSEQQLVDCDKLDHGCSGGSLDSGFRYCKNNDLCLLNDYAYVAHDQDCQKKCSDNIRIKDYCNVRPYDEEELKKAVSKQPVSIALDASSKEFQLYSNGIFDSTGCGTTLDHGVLIVGYGTEDGKDYWIVKNSWGESWGEDGYIRIARNVNDKKGSCGLAMMPVMPML